ncbi:MAG: type VI secretion system contractile sheath large subunit [Pseudomonadota bacterium]
MDLRAAERELKNAAGRSVPTGNDDVPAWRVHPSTAWSVLKDVSQPAAFYFLFGSQFNDITARDASRALAQLITAIDDVINEAVFEIVSHPRFTALEGRWRGLKWLTDTAGLARPSDRPKLKVLNASWGAISKDLDDHDDLFQTSTFDLLYNEEFGRAGGEPYGLLVSDHHFSHRSQGAHNDIATLRALAQLGAVSFCPIAVGASPSLFGIDQMGELDRRKDITTTFDSIEYQSLRQLRNDPSSRFLAFLAGSALMRDRFGESAARDMGTQYRDPIPHDAINLAWAPAAFSLAHVTIRAIINYNWPAAINGAVSQRYGSPAKIEPEGGVLTGLPNYNFHNGHAGDWQKIPVEVYLSRDQEAQLNALGFIAPRPCAYTQYAALHACPSAYSSEGRAEISKVGAFLPNIMSVARFAHAIKVIGRSWIGSLENADELQRYLQTWLTQYRRSTNPKDSDNDAAPLRDFRVKIDPVPNRAGCYTCNVRLQPHFQIDYVISEFELSTEIKQAV